MNNFMFLEAYLLNLRIIFSSNDAAVLEFISSNLHSYLFIVDFVSGLYHFLTKMHDQMKVAKSLHNDKKKLVKGMFVGDGPASARAD